MGDFFLVVRIFYRKPLETDNGIRLFSSIIRDERYFFLSAGYFSPGISLQDIFSLEIGLQDNFFSEITHTPPQTSNVRPPIIYYIVLITLLAHL